MEEAIKTASVLNVNLFIYLLSNYLGVCVWACLCRSEQNLLELILSFRSVGSRNGNQFGTIAFTW